MSDDVMQAHVVGRGEHFDGLCAARGADPDEVWAHEANASLRERRDDRHVLAPGDVVYLPEPAERTVALRAQTTNRYRAHVPTVPIRTRLLVGREPLANESFTVEDTEPVVEGTTDGDGRVDFEVPATRRRVVVATANGHRYPLRVGGLDPVDGDDGVWARLRNLGYLLELPFAPAVGREERRERLEHALRAFQTDHELEPTGELDDDTRSALRDQHGA